MVVHDRISDHLRLLLVSVTFLMLIPHMSMRLVSLLRSFSVIFYPWTLTVPVESKVRHSGQLLRISMKITPICYFVHNCMR
jgi:hypothetical protein